MLTGDASVFEIIEENNPVDADDDTEPTCYFTITEIGDQGPVTCRVELDSRTACVDALDCICRIWNPGSPQSSIDLCIGWELTPRGSISMADFCRESPPAYHTMAEALYHYLLAYGVSEDDLEISAQCEAVPALTGSAPYEACANLEGSLCPCIPGECDVNMLLGTRCLDMTRDQVRCIYDEVTRDPDRVCDMLEVLDEITIECADREREE